MRAGRTTLAATLAGLFLAVGLTSTADATPPAPRAWTSFDVTATATAVLVDTEIPDGPADDHLLAADGSRARARVDGLGRSEADAAAAAPGDTLRSLRGVAANLAGGAVPVAPPAPDLPLVVESSHPTVAQDEFGSDGIGLRATSGPTSSEGLAEWQGSITQARSTAAAHGAGNEALRATAEAEVRGFVAGPVSIAGLRTTATVERLPGGELERTSELHLHGLTVGGSAVAVGPQDPVETSTFQIRYLEAHETDTGVIAPGLVVTIVVPASPSDGPSTMTYVLGRATASATAVAAPARPRPAVEPTAAAGAVPPAPAPPADLAPPSPTPSPYVAAPESFPLQPTVAVTTAAQDPPRVELTAPRSLAPADPATWSIRWYTPLIVLGVALAAALRWFRRTGVRGTWT